MSVQAGAIGSCNDNGLVDKTNFDIFLEVKFNDNLIYVFLFMIN